MPELPEVEFVARALNELISARTIVNAELIRAKLASRIAPADFSQFLVNAEVNCVSRRGKYILIALSNGRTLLTHLRMTGRFLLLGPDGLDPKFAHAIFHFGDGQRLVFDDQRHFGSMHITETEKLSAGHELSKLAPEPLSGEFSEQYLHDTLRRSNRTIKELLLDQTKVCGLGNIYAAEALHLAGISPRRPARRLSRKSAVRLHRAIRAVLGEAVELSLSAGYDPENIAGSIYGINSIPNWRVYGRENEPCERCAAPIRRIIQGGRSTFYCARCQR